MFRRQRKLKLPYRRREPLFVAGGYAKNVKDAVAARSDLHSGVIVSDWMVVNGVPG